MNRTSRSVAAAALAAAVALGAVAPAVAAPQGGAGKPDKVAVKVQKQDKQKAAKEQREQKAEARLKRMADRKAGYLKRLAERPKVTRLGDVGADLAQKMKDDATTLAALTVDDADDIRSARPVVYHRIINQARLVVVNELGGELLAKVLEHDAWATKAELKATQLEIAGLLVDEEEAEEGAAAEPEPAADDDADDAADDLVDDEAASTT